MLASVGRTHRIGRREELGELTDGFVGLRAQGEVEDALVEACDAIEGELDWADILKTLARRPRSSSVVGASSHG